MNHGDRPLVTLDHNVLLGFCKAEYAAPARTPLHESYARAMRELRLMYRTGATRLMLAAAVTLKHQPLDEGAERERHIALGFDPEDTLQGLRGPWLPTDEASPQPDRSGPGRLTAAHNTPPTSASAPSPHRRAPWPAADT